MAVEIIGSSGYIADVDASGNVKVNIEASAGTVAVSAASLPLPTGAATAAGQITPGTAGSPSTQVISVQGVASGIVLPVSGTFFQATQPVSSASLPLPSNAAQETGGNLATIAAQMPAATAKGTQAATFGAVQLSKDTGRAKVILTLTKVTSITTEALVTLTIKKGDATTTTGTSYTISAGKTLRLQSILLSATLTVAGITAVAVRLREGAAGGGALALASDIISEVEVSANTATIGVSGQQLINFPDGLEITGGQIIGVSELATTVDAAVTLVITGYEY